jgi:diadenosine tetraphosphate (Ap4A) HIT family hydrolase
MSSLLWTDPDAWRRMTLPEGCPICTRGIPIDVLVELEATWVTAGETPPLLGYVCVVSKVHVLEPFQLSESGAAAFWRDVDIAASALADVFAPVKMNYEIHGNTMPHLHMHLYPRMLDDPLAGQWLTTKQFVRRPPELLSHIRDAMVRRAAQRKVPFAR